MHMSSKYSLDQIVELLSREVSEDCVGSRCAAALRSFGDSVEVRTLHDFHSTRADSGSDTDATTKTAAGR